MRWTQAGSVALLAAQGLPGCSDPVHDDAVAALGPEAPGVPTGPLHRPGQPCITCHGEAGPAEDVFVVAGTVHALARQPHPAPGAVVRLQDFSGSEVLVGTNAAGNFYVLESEWDPTFPLRVEVSLGTTRKQMATYVARSRSCADCHTDPPSTTSPGAVYVAVNPSELPPGFVVP